MSRTKLVVRRAWAGAAALALVSALGCAGGPYGTTRWDSDAARAFNAGQLQPGQRYYLNGSDVGPDVILALRDDRPLRSSLWHEVPMTAEKLKGLADRMRGVRVDGPWAYAVLDDRGERIGTWFSYWRPMPVRVLEGGGVDIAPPMKTDGEESPRGPDLDRDIDRQFEGHSGRR